MKVALSLAVLLLSPAALAAPRVFLRGGILSERSGDATVTDRDCTSTQPPALFGCVEGNDGRALAARGDFGDPLSFELAAGIEAGPRTRLELALDERANVDLEANANFPSVAENQPVRANGRSRALFAIATYELAPWRVRPFVSAGAGVARNELDTVTYAFPSIGANAMTITQGGEQTSFAWTAAAGASMSLTERLALDASLRYTDLGAMQTDDGSATIVRPSRTFMLDIAGTRAALRTIGVSVSLRFRL